MSDDEGERGANPIHKLILEETVLTTQVAARFVGQVLHTVINTPEGADLEQITKQIIGHLTVKVLNSNSWPDDLPVEMIIYAVDQAVLSGVQEGFAPDEDGG